MRLGDPEHRFHQFGAPRSHQARNSKNFAALDLETDITKSFPAQVLHIQKNRSQIGCFFMKHISQGAADHLFDEDTIGQISCRIGAHVLTIPEHRDLISYFEDLVHFMGDIDDRASLGFQ